MDNSITLSEYRLPHPMFLVRCKDKKTRIVESFYIRAMTAYRAIKVAKRLTTKKIHQFSAQMVDLRDHHLTWDDWCAYLVSEHSGLFGDKAAKQATVTALLAYRDKCLAADQRESQTVEQH